MDFEDSGSETRRGFGSGDPVPPEDWTGHGPSAQVAALYVEHQPQLARFFRRRAEPQDIGDLVQEVFRRFVSSRAGAPAPVDMPGAYLVRMARNLLAEHARTGARRMAADHDSFDETRLAGVDPHPALEARDAIRRAEEAIARLRPKTRDIFLMHRYDGLSYEEIAAARDMSVKGVEKQIAKALVALRRTRTARP